ncbi:50S ribosomal protein L13 [Mycoplasma phocimorsus]|uniref:Large ribosomal subunit protein uL13 n=1 Tax=Mycoplasma phocimorsus TaxID=3045839 RepID=A0AAJ1UZB3_9MOLU|nr:50S ribosomal protein L13 [Mycoplasma phocimorsus]MDJ1645553.1 50S ribosomal protein L13 [Mycoplasma phocimorsus]MDJ1646604.1 50S ribosomal protein L13 [Mycoplasma phocimorsus]MDJ1647122.1 50S ribosomal protein L13 [Mycoplasma phocimorsus]MDJ1647557.1 50S ribosomal protein L13 [Mycoplasma phocimorsus]MDJ1648099.1 50S ribosomal protein L13 [Mycoplasma phocimorsus]
MRQTTNVKHLETDKKWLLIDAKDLVLGRTAARIATILMGKHKPSYTKNVDMGDNIVVINAGQIKLTANKELDKKYYHHSGYPGGLKVTNAHDLRAKKPIALLEKAVKGMLPHTKLGRKQFRNLYVYAGSEHSQQAQQPVKIEVL